MRVPLVPPRSSVRRPLAGHCARLPRTSHALAPRRPRGTQRTRRGASAPDRGRLGRRAAAGPPLRRHPTYHECAGMRARAGQTPHSPARSCARISLTASAWACARGLGRNPTAPRAAAPASHLLRVRGLGRHPTAPRAAALHAHAEAAVAHPRPERHAAADVGRRGASRAATARSTTTQHCCNTVQSVATELCVLQQSTILLLHSATRRRSTCCIAVQRCNLLQRSASPCCSAVQPAVKQQNLLQRI